MALECIMLGQVAQSHHGIFKKYVLPTHRPAYNVCMYICKQMHM